MRINRFVASASGLSRRAADQAIASGRVQVNGQPAVLGQAVSESDRIMLDNQPLKPAEPTRTIIMLNKPVGFVVSRSGQGSQTIYELLPPALHHLKPVGRLDKDSSGLLLLTNDGQLAQQLTHPSQRKIKIYEIELDKPLTPEHRQQIERGVQLTDGLSRLQLAPLGSNRAWQVTMHEGRNRQIRRTFAQANYRVMRLHRQSFGPYSLGKIPPGKYTAV